MKLYLSTIKFFQEVFLIVSIVIMMVLPLVLVFMPEKLSEETILNLYGISHFFVFFVMLIRPLADIFINTKWIRPLVILRKGTGVLSASVVISFIFAKLIIDPAGYFEAFATQEYWSVQNFALFAHLADISAVLLLITSNNLSKRLLGAGWKRIQKLSYVFFYGSSLYVFLTFSNVHVLYSMIVITIMTFVAYILNTRRRRLNLETI